jgi:hypothetical protein
LKTDVKIKTNYRRKNDLSVSLVYQPVFVNFKMVFRRFHQFTNRFLLILKTIFSILTPILVMLLAAEIVQNAATRTTSTSLHELLRITRTDTLEALSTQIHGCERQDAAGPSPSPSPSPAYDQNHSTALATRITAQH